jgi:predicted NUDIX family NTP pyrophosphohydrolase
VLLFRRQGDVDPELLIVHMGGPSWKNKDAAAWSIPKGELEEGDEALPAALREFEEELGSPLPPVELVELGEITQAGGKRIVAFAGEGDFDVSTVRSNTFTIEWPPRSGKQQEFPEIDRAAWVNCDEARVKLVKGQVELVDRLLDLLGTRPE